jgi:hypothetical protein
MSGNFAGLAFVEFCNNLKPKRKKPIEAFSAFLSLCIVILKYRTEIVCKCKILTKKMAGLLLDLHIKRHLVSS